MTMIEATIEAHKLSKTSGYAFAVLWPAGHATVEVRKPSLRMNGMKVVCCEDGREEIA